MAVFFVDALLGFVADDADFIAFDFGLDDFGRDFDSLDFGRANRGLVAVNHEQSTSLELFGAFREEVHP